MRKARIVAIGTYLIRMLPLLVVDVAFSNAAYHIAEEVGVWRSWMPEHDDVTPAASAKCSTTTLRLPGKEPLRMCIMGHDQFISNQMRRHYRWYECADLVRFWNEGSGQHVRGGVFLEVGANIGACSLEVALSVANASMLLFEPNPLNFFHLTSSLKWAYEAGRLSAGRVVAFPLGAGSRALEANMYEQVGNTGNSIVGAMVGSKSRNFIRRMIHVRPLDAIFPHGLHVELMKVDVQGYECEVFRGMRELLASQQVRKIHFEVWAEGLAAQNCSKEQLVDTLLADGYELRISGADSTASKASNMPVISGGAGDAASSPFTPSAKSEHLFEIEARLVRGRSRRGRAGEAPTKVQ